MVIKRTILPRWATDDVTNPTSGLNNVVEPSEAKKNLGWDYLEKPARQYYNWLGRQTNQWFEYLDDVINLFAPYETDPPTMTVMVNKGHINVGTDVLHIAAQITPTFTVPLVNPRIDRLVVSESSGLAAIIVGTESLTPTPPPFLVSQIPLAEINLYVGITEITNADIIDERSRSPFTGNVTADFFLQQIASEGIGVYSQNQTTGLTFTDGFFSGIDANENANLWNYENTNLIFATNNTFRGKIDNSGKWLISADGTEIAPQYDLVINNSTATPVYIQVTNAATGTTLSDGFTIGIDSTGGADIWNAENQDLRFATNNTLRGKVSANGNWLITKNGTDILPSRELVLYDGGAGEDVYIQFVNDSTGITGTNGFGVGLNAADHALLWNYETTDLWFATNNTFRGKVDSNGNWLISPDGSLLQPLHSLVVYNGAAASFSYAQFVNDGTGFGINSGFIVGVDSSERATIWNYHNSDMQFATNNTFRGKIDNGGKWLISPDGTNIEPQHELVLYKNSTSQNCFIQLANLATENGVNDGFIVGISTVEDAELWNFENTNMRFATNNVFRGKIASSGNWLISPDGVDISPARELVIYGNTTNSNSIIQFVNAATNIGSGDGFLVGIDGGENALLLNSENTPMLFSTNNTERMRIEADGSVEIGTGLVNQGVGTLNALNGVYVNNQKINSFNFRGALIYSTTNQSIGTSAEAINFNGESYDTDNIHSPSINNERLTVPANVSKIRLHGQVSFSASVNGTRQLRITRSQATAWAGHPTIRQNATSDGGSVLQIISAVINVSPGQYFELKASVTSTIVSALGDASGSLTWFAMELIE